VSQVRPKRRTIRLLAIAPVLVSEFGHVLDWFRWGLGWDTPNPILDLVIGWPHAVLHAYAIGLLIFWAIRPRRYR